jgi:hypothetical protein
MNQEKLIDLKHTAIFTLIAVFTALAACTGTPASDSTPSDTGNEGKAKNTTNEEKPSSARNAPEPLFTGNGGKGLVIAVPAPAISGCSQSDNWMPQLFQDLITADLARYSSMTVLDRLNESLVLAEQQLSASGNYSDSDYISIGHLTNAKYITVGNILGVSGRYLITFRINDTTTIEIQASFSKQYSREDIESGLAAKEAVLELLAGLGIELTAIGKQQLLARQENTVRAQVKLAQGMASEKNDSLVESLAYFFEALNADQGMKEASQHIQNFAQGLPGNSIRERANWAIAQKEKWEKVFNDLVDYVDNNLLIAIYDFSTIEDQFNARNNTVDITVKPGVKIISDSMVLTVWKFILDQWDSIKNKEENKSWANSLTVKSPLISRWAGGSAPEDIRRGIGKDPLTTDRSYYAIINLYDDIGIRISQNAVRLSRGVIKYEINLQILPQERYFNAAPFQPVTFVRVKISDITDNLSAGVYSIAYGLIYASDGLSLLSGSSPYGAVPARIMSKSEYDAWLKK